MRYIPLFKKVFLFFILLVVIVSAVSLLYIWHDEKSYYTSKSLTQTIEIEGSYTIFGEGISKPLPKDYKFNLSGYNTIIVKGHFTKDIPSNKRVIMRMKNIRLKIFVNDNLIFNFGSKGSIPDYVKSSGNMWGTFISPGVLATDNITLEISNVYDNKANDVFGDFLKYLYYGYERDLIIRNISASSINCFASICIIAMGLVVASFSVVLYRMKKPVLPYVSLACIYIFSGMWFFIDFTVQSYFFSYPILNNSLKVVSFILSIGFVVLYFALVLRNKWRGILIYCAAGWFVLTLVATICQLAGVADYYDFFSFITVASMVSLIIVGICLLKERSVYHDKDATNIIVAFSFLFFGGIASMVCGRFVILSSISLYKIGFFLFLLSLAVIMALRVKGFLLDNARLHALEEESQNLARVLEYQQLITEATRGLYENIYEIDITHDKGVGESIQRYFEGVGLPAGVSFSVAINHVAEKQIKEDFRQGYLDIFSPENVLKAYVAGIDKLCYDFMTSANGKDYYWMRVTARIFFWKSDKSVRMIIYRQNINEEKCRENILSERAKRDPLTGLYNKVATEDAIKKLLIPDGSRRDYAFFILDIDDFKSVNDTMGHAIGDLVIREFAKEFKAQFRDSDIIGRIGGDEFVIFIPIPDIAWLDRKAHSLVTSLCNTINTERGQRTVSASVGLAIYPKDGADFETLYQNADKALYQTKKRGKNGYTIYRGE